MLRWDTEKKREGARKDLRDALTEQFNSIYGTDVENIKNWQLLCRVLGISPVSEDLDECRHVRSAIFCVQCAILDKSTGGVKHPCQSR